ncbi:MAG: translocation/assembly module TamB domain-containing protein [Proteobacteria bacterium]|nr:translocation/assembly module TamB domain-containing protein [Pseudomonadota bacterium]
MPPPEARAAPLATTLRLLLPLAMMVSLLLLVGGALYGGARWLLASEDGARWLLGVLPGVQAEGVRGTLLGPRFEAERLRVQWAGGEESVHIEGLDLQGIAWRRSADAALWLELDIARAAARRVVVDTGATGPRPLPAPSSLAAPLRARIAAAELDELRIDQLAPLTALAARGVVFDGGKGRTHRVAAASARGWGLAMQAGASIGNVAPLQVQLSGTVEPAGHGAASPPWSAAVTASGPLPRIALEATLRGRTPPARGPGGAPAAPQLQAQAELHLLEAWPLQHVRASTEALDLAALWADAPRTRLSGRVEISAPAAGAPITADVQLRNLAPGRWDEHRLPISGLTLQLRGDPSQPARVQASRIELDLADAAGAAGHAGGNLLWDGHRMRIDARLADVTPQRLDGRAAAMTLGGPLEIALQGLPSPDRADASVPPPWHAEVKLALVGRIAGAPTPVSLEAQGAAAAGRLELARVHAQAGAASADLKATLARTERGAWQLASSGSVDDFDPLAWWPGVVASAWRQGPHRIDADWQLDVRAPADAQRLPPLALLQSLAGSGRLRVHDSVLAGVPLAADIALGSGDAGSARGGSATGSPGGSPRGAPGSAPANAGMQTRSAAAATSTLHAQITAGGNQLTIDGRADSVGNGADDRWQLAVQADKLAALAPLARLHPALAEWLPRAGSATASIAAHGRWPRMASDGEAHVERLQAGTLAVARGDLRWRLQVGTDIEANAPLVLNAELSGMRLGEQRADQLSAQLRGTLGAHRIELRGTLPVAPPPLVERLLGPGTARGTRALLQAQGHWQPGAAGGAALWRAQIERLALGPWDGTGAADAPLAGALWAETRDLRAELTFDHQGALETLQADPGRLLLAGGTLALHWDAVHVDLRGARPGFDLRAEVEPFALAPLLARVQPTMGWAGDLRLAARVAVSAGERFDAEFAFERRAGDLQLSSGDGAALSGDEGVQPLGLTELRLAITAHDGVWNFSPVFSGRSLGDIRGTLRARTSAQARWPQPDAPIDGEIQARVADIGIWTPWVPPGWRLTGRMQTTASVGGRFGEPTYTGELSASGLGVRSLLQGVNVSDGELRAVLAGETARIEHFTVKGGEGSVTIGGGASLGSQPSARLQLDAERFRVLGRIDRQLTLSGHAELALGTEASRVDGSFRVDEGLFDFSRADAPSLDDDVNVHGNGPAQAPPLEPQAARQRREFAIALDVDLGDHVRARGRGVDTGLRGKLRITNPGGRLDVVGTIRTDQGTYAAYGQKLDIERGAIVFTGVVDNPRLDILAIRPNTDTRVGLQVLGSAQAPRVQLYSEPEMSESDKLSWLLLGRPSEGLGRSDSAIIQRAAVALLAGEGEAPTDTLLRRLGLDDLSVRQSDTDVHETVISLGKQLSRRWYVGYERGVNATAGTWQLIYRIAQRLTVRMQSGFENALDIIWTWRFQEAPLEGGVRKSVPAKAP